MEENEVTTGLEALLITKPSSVEAAPMYTQSQVRVLCLEAMTYTIKMRGDKFDPDAFLKYYNLK